MGWKRIYQLKELHFLLERKIVRNLEKEWHIYQLTSLGRNLDIEDRGKVGLWDRDNDDR